MSATFGDDLLVILCRRYATGVPNGIQYPGLEGPVYPRTGATSVFLYPIQEDDR
jgi:hypothetical protein